MNPNANNPDFSSFIGKRLNAEVTEDQIKQHANAQIVRVLTPTSPMTMDLCWERVNIIIDDDGKIMSITIG